MRLGLLHSNRGACRKELAEGGELNDTQNSDAVRLRRYLLGESTEEERTTVERRLMTDQEYLDDLARTEEGLIDDYARGHLSPDETKKFEAMFFNVPERREKIAFAQALQRYLARRQAGQSVNLPVNLAGPRWPRAAIVGMSAAVALLILLSGVLAWQAVQLRRSLAAAERQRATAERDAKLASQQLTDQQKRNQELLNEIASLRNNPSQADLPIVKLLLTSGSTRSGDPLATAHLAPSTKWLQVELRIGDDETRSKNYRAEVQRADGTAVWSRNSLKATRRGENGVVSVKVPTSALGAGDYQVMVTGQTSDGASDEVGTYYFQIVRK